MGWEHVDGIKTIEGWRLGTDKRPSDVAIDKTRVYSSEEIAEYPIVPRSIEAAERALRMIQMLRTGMSIQGGKRTSWSGKTEMMMRRHSLKLNKAWIKLFDDFDISQYDEYWWEMLDIDSMEDIPWKIEECPFYLPEYALNHDFKGERGNVFAYLADNELDVHKSFVIDLLNIKDSLGRPGVNPPELLPETRRRAYRSYLNKCLRLLAYEAWFIWEVDWNLTISDGVMHRN